MTTLDLARTDHLVATAALLWPEPAVPRLTSSRSTGHGPSPSPSTREFLVVPNARAPRLLVPLRARAAGSRAMRRYSHGLTGRERVMRTLLAAGIRTGLAGLLVPDRLVVTGVAATASGAMADAADPPSIEAYLGAVLGQDVVIGFGVGRPRANQKPVLNVLTPRGRSIGFVKVGDTDVARALVRREAAALELVERAAPAGVEAPRVLHLGTWRGLDLLVQSALVTRMRRGRPAAVLPVAAMAAVASIGGRTRSRVADAPFWDALLRTPSQLREPQVAARLQEALAAFERHYADRIVEVGSWHGDWTPWNMAWRHDEVQLWDWERFSVGVPVGFDLLHYQLQSWLIAGTTHRLGPETFPAGVRESLRAIDVDAEDMTVDLYLAELCCRYLLASGGSIGAPLRAGATWLLDIVHARAST